MLRILQALCTRQKKEDFIHIPRKGAVFYQDFQLHDYQIWLLTPQLVQCCPTKEMEKGTLLKLINRTNDGTYKIMLHCFSYFNQST